MTYSQHDEDGYIYRLIKDNKLKITPVFCDFGACDGIHLSNTRLFAEMGWGGVMVEANPDYYAKLLNNYIHRDDITTINAAVSDHSGFETFYVYPEKLDHSGLHDKPMYKPYYDVQIPVVEAADIVPKECGVFSIDVEGQEQSILFNIFAANIYPEIIITESNTIQDRTEQIFLLNNRYHLLNVLNVNTIWIRKDLWMQ